MVREPLCRCRRGLMLQNESFQDETITPPNLEDYLINKMQKPVPLNMTLTS